MDVEGRTNTARNYDVQSEEEEMTDLRRGPWTVEEDFALINYIAHHGEGRWNSLARSAGLKRTGKSCRLRWLNYLRPDVRRGDITLEEQLLILELHSRWGNRWSKIAQHLPGRTDNEIKNYWRTRVQKHAKQLKCDVNSKQFKDTMRYLWMPRLVERIQAAATTTKASSATPATTSAANSSTNNYNINDMDISSTGQVVMPHANDNIGNLGGIQVINHNFTSESSSTAVSSDSFGRSEISPVSDLTDCYSYPVNYDCNQDYLPANQFGFSESLISPSGYYYNQPGLNFQQMDQNNSWVAADDVGGVSDNLWNDEDIWFLQQQFNNNV